MLAHAVILIFQRLREGSYEFKLKERKERKTEGKERGGKKSQKKITIQISEEKKKEKIFQRDTTHVTKKPYTGQESPGEHRRKMERSNVGGKKERRSMRNRN